jgi:hypothetical protein
MTSAKERAVEAGARFLWESGNGPRLSGCSWDEFPDDAVAKIHTRATAAVMLRAAFPILAEDASDALDRVSVWATAYPQDVFPDVDLKKARQVLEEAGISFDALHGTWARHIMTGVADIVDPARARIQQMAEAL